MNIFFAIYQILKGVDTVTDPNYKPLVSNGTTVKLLMVVAVIAMGIMLALGQLDAVLGAYLVPACLIVLIKLVVKIVNGFRETMTLPKSERPAFLKKQSRSNNLYALKLIGITVLGVFILLGLAAVLKTK